MTEALEFFKAIEGKSADQLKEDAKVQRYKERWRNTTFGKKKLQLNQLQDLFGFACEHGGKEDVEEFQKLAQESGHAPAGQLRALRTCPWPCALWVCQGQERGLESYDPR